MSLIKKIASFTLLAFVFGSCNSVVPRNWIYMVPNETPFIILPSRKATLQSALNSQHIPLLDNVSSSSLALIERVDSTATQPLQLKSILLYPGTDLKLQPIWVMEPPGDFMENMKEVYAQPYGQNYYYFHEVPILKIRTREQFIFAAQINDLLLVSESSLGIENVIRVYRGQSPGAYLEDIALKPGSIIMNTSALEGWATQQAKVSYSPSIQNTFSGTRPALLEITRKDSASGGGLHLSGMIPVSGESASTLIKAISSQNKPLTLDEYISNDVAAFAIFRQPPVSELPEVLSDTTAVDSFFINNTEQYRKIAATLNSEFAVVLFAESGFRSINEHAFIRKVKNPDDLQTRLNNLANKNLLEHIEDVYFVRSTALCRLIGSRLCDFKNFYIKIVDDAVIISPRKGLAAVIASDYRRRQVVIYEPFYKKIEQDLPKKPSGVIVGGTQLLTYLQPFLKNSSYVGALTSMFDYIAIAAQKNGSGISFDLYTYHIESKEQPYRENWIFSTGGATLSGPPIFADIVGSANQEVIFATESGSVYSLAADGTVIRRLNTNKEQPIGSPVAYDWYGTGEKVILVAAGNKIFAWDQNGELLPKFPFILKENITSPLVITDLNNNGLPDVVVATANRELHALNARGEHLFGWPVKTNSVISTKPLVTRFRNRTAIVAFASNAIHVWGTTGRNFAGFPRFIDATLKGSPVLLDDEILGAGADGYLYSFGDGNQFDNSLDTSNKQFLSSGSIEKLYVSGSALTGTPLITNQSKIAVMGINGSVYVLNEGGVLLQTQNMGQAPAPNWIPVLADLNNDKKNDIIAIADYGRLYAWQLSSGERLHQLPTAAMHHVSIGDVDGDGLMEVVAQTEDGVQSWTIN